MTRAILFALGLLIPVACIAELGLSQAMAQNIPNATRQVGVATQSDHVSLSVSIRDMATADIQRKLQSGLPQHLTVHVTAMGANTGAPISSTLLMCSITYDLWDETYQVEWQRRSSTEGETRHLKLTTLPDAISACFVIKDLPSVKVSQIQSSKDRAVFFIIDGEFNPLSPEGVGRIKRWLARSGTSSPSDNDSFFGSFAGLFVGQRVGGAEKTLRFRTQRIEVSPWP